MQLRSTEHGVEWILSRAEAHFIAHILDHIRTNYASDAAGAGHPLDQRALECLQKSGMSEEDLALWQEERSGFRGTHSKALNQWQRHLAGGADDWLSWSMTPREIEIFLLIANDHRMYLARRFGVTEQDMESGLKDIDDENRRMALVEIHLLAQMMEMLLPYAPL